MTPKQRLSAYERALTDYQNGIGKNQKYLLDNGLLAGLCRYFSRIQGINVCRHYMKNILPELYLQEPSPLKNSLFWFKLGALRPRIRCLKRAIALTKKLMNYDRHDFL